MINDLPHGSDLIFQEKIIQCEEMNLLNPESINTIRIVTENLSGSPQVFSSVLRVGNKNTGNVDNWATGGIAIGIKADGTLKQYGFMKPINGLKVDCHPDTGVVFSEFKVPYYVEACELACKAHKAFYNVATIGWDIAISNVGPIIIEGNDNWEISLMQACNEGYKQKWSNLIKNFM